MSLLFFAGFFAGFSAGCVSAPTEVTVAELCAAGPTYDGAMFTVTLDLSSTQKLQRASSLRGCTEEDPCCNTGFFVHSVACQAGPDLVLSPARETWEPDPEDLFLCYGRTTGRTTGFAVGEPGAACEAPDCTTTGVITLDVTARVADGFIYLDAIPAAR